MHVFASPWQDWQFQRKGTSKICRISHPDCHPQSIHNFQAVAQTSMSGNVLVLLSRPRYRMQLQPLQPDLCQAKRKEPACFYECRPEDIDSGTNQTSHKIDALFRPTRRLLTQAIVPGPAISTLPCTNHAPRRHRTKQQARETDGNKQEEKGYKPAWRWFWFSG